VSRKQGAGTPETPRRQKQGAFHTPTIRRKVRRIGNFALHRRNYPLI